MPQPDPKPVLVADVGGTNTRVALAQGLTLVAGTTRRFRNEASDGLDAVLRDYLRDCPHSPDRAAIALAGPVRGTRAEMTNLGWQVDSNNLACATGLSSVALLNDLQAQGHALPYLPSSALKTIRHGTPQGKTRLVIGLGTGVNMAQVVPVAGGYTVPPSEAGHIRLALHDPLDHALAEWLVGATGFASVEDVLAGRGLERLYAFHAARAGGGAARDAAAIMSAMAQGDPLAEATGRHYIRLLAQVTADLALITLPYGGIAFIGGVARAFAPYFDSYGFEDAFSGMGRFSDLVAEFPVAIVEDDFAALTGCAAYLASS